MKVQILLMALTAYVSAQSDPFENFLNQLAVKVKQTNYDACNKLSYDQSRAASSQPDDEVITLDSCMQESNQISEKLLFH